MARRTGAKNGVCVHTTTTTYLVIYCSLLLPLLQTSVFARPTSELEVGTGSGHDFIFGDLTGSFFASSWLGIGVSLSFLIVLASLLVLCGAAGCCGKIHWFGSTRQETPLSFSNPMTEPGATMMVPISQIDVRALELDPIVFEPLPTVRDLTPLSNKTHQSDRRGLNSGHRNPVIPIVPFSADDSAVYAHDWFEEPHNNFPRKNIEYVKEIGKGWFGQVIEAEARDIVPFAKKIRVIVKLLREDANGIEQMRFLDESRMYRDGDHGNILKLMGHSIEKLPFLLIMEYCPQGDLKSFLISNVIRAEMLNSQGTIVKMALDVSKGLEWLHNAGFVHPDLAARNSQVGSENRVVIGDYGLGTQNFKDDYHWSSSAAIPLRWTAPETLHCTSSVIQILKVTETSNIWTLGVVIWEICEFGKLPYFELADDEVISRVIIDKNFSLGRPTMPCMSAKEELYNIISSCWKADLESRPRLYTIVRELEELYSAFLGSTEQSGAANIPFTSPPADEFDSKWEQLAGRSNSTEDEKRRKKNVSFLDLEKQVCPKFNLNQSFITEEEEQQVEGKGIESVDASKSNASSTSMNVTATSEADHQKEIDLDEEQWTKKIERGDISQKVLEKSQSVQDLMVLTHFEQGDMGELDSLPYVAKHFLQDQSSVVSTSSSKGAGDDSERDLHDDSTVSSSNGGVGSSKLKKSCSEPAIDTLSIANSSHTLTPGSECESTSSQTTLVPQSMLSPTTPPSAATESKLPPNINLITATPNPPVEINVIQPSPKPEQVSSILFSSPSSSSSSSAANNQTSSPSSHSVSQADSSTSSVAVAGAGGVNRKLHFKFDDPPSSPLKTGLNPEALQSRQRLTSTPLRSGSTPSPRVSDFGDLDGNEGNENVFETSSGFYMEGTFSLSPISQSYISGSISNGSRMEVEESVNGSSVLFGASDDHELGSYQEVKSQIHEVRQSHSDETEESSSSFPSLVLTTSESRQKQPPRRFLFPNGDSSVSDEEGSKNNGTSASSACDGDTTTTTTTTTSATSSGSVFSLEANCSTRENEVSKVESTENGNDDQDQDEFWKIQLRSLQMAADSTRELFHTGLNEPGTSDNNKRLAEDIEADVEELGSLVLHDLEEPDSLQTIIKETREPLQSDDGVNAAKLAFESSKATTSSQASNDPFQTGFINSTRGPSNMDATPNVWDINNSIEISKERAANDKLPSVSNEVKPVGHENDSDEDNGEEAGAASSSTEFVPSKWDQSLIPSRSAIKSPEQQTQPKSSGMMRKSVSFEMKKTHLVYEYPPPPPDLEEDEPRKGIMLPSSTSNPLAASLDWELTQEELEDAEINHEDWEDEVVPKPGDPMDMYRISGFSDDNFQVRCSNEPFVFSPITQPSSSSTLGELRHTRDRLRLDLSRGEANFLDDELAKSSSNPAKLVSGVGSSTNVSPFNINCDILTKRSKHSD